MRSTDFSVVPPYRLTRFAGHPDTLRAMVNAVQGVRGEQSMMVRAAAEDAVRAVQPKDYLGEILAIQYWVAERVRYLNDPAHIELVKDCQRLIEEVHMYGTALGDCDELASLTACMCMQVGRVAEFVVVGFGAPGEYSHVFSRVREPRSQQWVVIDIVAGTDVRGMLDSVTTWYSVSCDEPAERIAA